MMKRGGSRENRPSLWIEPDGGPESKDTPREAEPKGDEARVP